MNTNTLIDNKINEKIEEFEKRFTYMGSNQADQLQRSFKPYTDPYDVESFLRSSLLEVQRVTREGTIEKYKPVLDDAYATQWLRNVYGLDDDGTLNAGEVEELLETFISDHSRLKDKK